MQRTVRIKIENDKVLAETLSQYRKAYELCIDAGFKMRTSNKVRIHNATYRNIRNNYPKLSSALIQTVRDVACENLKAAKLKTKPVPKNEFIRFDKRTFSFKDGTASISTTGGRKKLPISIPKYFDKYSGWDCKSAVLSKRNNRLFLNLIFKKEATKVVPSKVLGIDRGINNIAVASDNAFYNSKHLKDVKGRYQYLKAELQAKGTPSAKRKLEKISGREKRFVRDVNHCISKEIVAKDYDGFALENLKNIRKAWMGRKFNRKIGNWSFYQLEGFLNYKAEELGKTVLKVNPRHTSQMCSVCEYIHRLNRDGNVFRCRKCGFELNADLNASRNLAKLGIAELGRLSVNQPNVTTEMSVTSPRSSEVGN